MYDLEKKFIFTHPPKCGGTSLEDMFGFLDLRNKYPQIHRFKHASLEYHIQELQNKNYDTNLFYIFSIIRNPWDRAVSYYHHYKYKEYNFLKEHKRPIPKYVQDARNLSFKNFIFKYWKNINSEKLTKPFMFYNNNYCVNYVVRLENLKEDLDNINNRIQIDFSNEIPHRNNSDEFINRKHYTEYYDEELKRLIQRLFEWDIKTFGYNF